MGTYYDYVRLPCINLLDAVARISRMSFRILLEVEEGETPSQLVSVLTNKYALLISLFFGYLLSLVDMLTSGHYSVQQTSYLLQWY